jgi:N-acetylneuraminate lyase
MKLQGILPAVVTPLTKDGEFAEGVYEKLLERVYAAGVDGIYVAGQTGEGFQLPVKLRKRLAEVSVRLTPPGKQSIVHIGAVTTADAVELAKHAANIHATAISSLPPPGPWSFGEVKEYYRAVSTAGDFRF